MTERMIAAVEHPWLDAIGHPTGRKIETRPPYAIDMTAVIAAAAKHGTMIEINAAPDRRDMNESHARAAAEAGVLVLVDSDAHSARNFDLLQYGIATARRAWLTPEQVANTRSWKDFAPLRKRARAVMIGVVDSRPARPFSITPALFDLARWWGCATNRAWGNVLLRTPRHARLSVAETDHLPQRSPSAERSRGSSRSATTRSTAAGENGSSAAAARSA